VKHATRTRRAARTRPPRTSSVEQGSTGDCCFLSALALATRDSSTCHDLIDDSLEEKGIYGVTFSVDGEWAMVYVDSWFPCYTKNGHDSRPKPVYATSQSQGDLAHGGREGLRQGACFDSTLPQSVWGRRVL
jgi:hypothetical protein